MAPAAREAERTRPIAVEPACPGPMQGGRQGTCPPSTGVPAGPAALGCPISQTRRLAQRTPTAPSEVVEAAMPPGAGCEACGARARLSRGHDLEAAPGLVEERRRQLEGPLFVGRQAIAPQAALGEALQLVRQLDGFRQRRSRLHQPVGEAHALRLVARHAASGEDEVEGVAVAEQAGEANGPAVDEGDAPAPAED